MKIIYISLNGNLVASTDQHKTCSRAKQAYAMKYFNGNYPPKFRASFKKP
jgi:hypothetical protein